MSQVTHESCFKCRFLSQSVSFLGWGFRGKGPTSVFDAHIDGGLGPRFRGDDGWVLKILLFPIISEHSRSFPSVESRPRGPAGPVVRRAHREREWRLGATWVGPIRGYGGLGPRFRGGDERSRGSGGAGDIPFQVVQPGTIGGPG